MENKLPSKMDLQKYSSFEIIEDKWWKIITCFRGAELGMVLLFALVVIKELDPILNGIALVGITVLALTSFLTGYYGEDRGKTNPKAIESTHETGYAPEGETAT